MKNQFDNSLSVGFLGSGRMATALAAGMIRGGLLSPENVAAYDISAAAAQSFQTVTNAQTLDSINSLVERSSVLILAVKPQHLSELLEQLALQISDDHLMISIAAGVTLETLEMGLGNTGRVVRVMPNTPCIVGAGASGFSLGSKATEEDGELVERLLSTVGVVAQVPEALLDAVTGLSGSGPAYVYQFIEALSDGGVRMGLSRVSATQLAAQTVLGAAKMVLETGEHPGTLKDAVTSPGGTTIAGIHALERSGLRGIVMDAVETATLRSRELGKPS